jgi:hypothetical protein
MTDTKPAMEEEIDDDHPGPGYELVCDHDAWWKLYYNKAEGRMAVSMSEEDSAEIEALAKAEAVSIEVYFRRKLGFPDQPPQECASGESATLGNDNQLPLYRDMAHVKYFASVWKVSPAEVIAHAAEAIDNEYSWDDIQYQLAATVQHSERLMRRMMAGKKMPPDVVVDLVAKHAWLLLLIGEMARRTGTTTAMKDITAQAEQFQKTLDLLQTKTAT